MTDETKIEILKIAVQLTVMALDKSGATFGKGPRPATSPNLNELFAKGVELAQAEFDKLGKGQ